MSNTLCRVAKSLFAKYRYRARKQNLPFHLTVEDFILLISEPCHYCGKKFTKRRSYDGVKFYTAYYNGVDRKSSKRGYTAKNVLTACKLCNRMKGDVPYREFLNHVSLINVAGGR